MRIGFEDKEHGKRSAAVCLPKSRIHIITRDISLFRKTNPRPTEQYLASFPHRYAMFCCKFVFNLRNAGAPNPKASVSRAVFAFSKN
ncbi:MAG: hypothetical protein R2932_33690 [Caldilineaceae bacterium]